MIGLSSINAQELQKKYGFNTLPEKPLPSNFLIFLAQFKSPLVYVLLLACLVTFFLQQFEDTLIILLALVINTILGYIQESRAGKTLLTLKSLIQPHARVYRDGVLTTISASDIVPGDVVLVYVGEKIPADGVFIESNRIHVSEALLTGESIPIVKNVDDLGFMSTIVISGKGLLLVEKIGYESEIGKIAKGISLSDGPTPLTKQLATFSRLLSIIIFLITGLVFIIGLLLGKSINEVFSTSVALAVSAIPEGLLVSMTVILAVGMQRILKKRGLVKSLSSAETLGGVTTICTDKTGTLTEGILQVVDVIGDERLVSLQVTLAGDKTDPLELAAGKWSKNQIKDPAVILSKYTQLDSVPFSSEERLLVSLNKYDELTNIIYVNGAPDVLINNSNLTQEQKDSYSKQIQKLTYDGKRVVGYAQKIVPNTYQAIEMASVKESLTFTGALAFTDPVRKDVSDALQKTQSAGIKLIIITGDYAQTAKAIAADLSIAISDNDIILGEQLDTMSDNSLRDWLSKSSSVKLFARTKPIQKLKIVEALKANGEVVAMMGDGVNDAPALSRADIGIVVDNASDVARESSDLILLDSSFSTIVSAIEEGRGIFDNIRKIILYLIGDSFEEIVAILLALVTFSPLPLSASQILWINIVSDGFPNLALTVDPKAKDIMQRVPRDPKEPLVVNWMKVMIMISSIVGGVLSFALYYYVLHTTANEVLAKSVAFAALGMDSLLYVFSVKTLKQPFWMANPFNNKWLNLSIFIGFLFQIAPFVYAPLGRFFNVVWLGNYRYGVLLVSILLFSTMETTKYIFNRFSQNS